MKKIILFNFIFVSVLFSFSELYFWNKMNSRFQEYTPFFKNKVLDFLPEYPSYRFVPFNSNYKMKKPVLLLGCSYVYGDKLSVDDNVSSKLIKLTGRWVYNLGFSGVGPIYFLMSLKGQKEKPIIEEIPEYVIYVYMFHHPERYYFSHFYNYYRKQNWIPFQKYSKFDELYTLNYFRNNKIEEYFSNDPNYERKMKLFFNILTEIKRESDELFPNSKFVVLIYSDVNKDLCEGLWNSVNYKKERMDKLFEIMYSDNFKQRIKTMGIDVITTEELIGRKMNKASDRAVDDVNHPHPSSNAWDEILPQLVKRLDL